MVYTNNPCPRTESTQNNERERKIYRVTIYGAVANILGAPDKPCGVLCRC